jgi:hypothetical protein
MRQRQPAVRSFERIHAYRFDPLTFSECYTGEAVAGGQALALHRKLGVLVLLSCDAGPPSRMVPGVQRKFLGAEPSLLQALLECWSWTCPYERLVARCKHGFVTVTPEMLGGYHVMRDTAPNAWQELLRPVDEALADMRLRLSTFGLVIRHTPGQGYTLAPIRRKERKREPS